MPRIKKWKHLVRNLKSLAWLMNKRKKCNMIYQKYKTKCNKIHSQKVTEVKIDGLKKGMEAKMYGVEDNMDGVEAKMDGIEEKIKGNMEDLSTDLTKLLQEMLTNGESVVMKLIMKTK